MYYVHARALNPCVYMRMNRTGKVTGHMWGGGGGRYSTSHHTALHGVFSSDALAHDSCFFLHRLLHVLTRGHRFRSVTVADALQHALMRRRRLWVQVHPGPGELFIKYYHHRRYFSAAQICGRSSVNK